MPVIINGSTGISGTDGSAGTPALQGTDGNTGMFFPAADQIAFAVDGVEAMRLDASGNVGIGTTVPGAKLQITDNTFSQLYLNSTNLVAGVRFGNSANTTGFIYYDNGPNMLFSVNNSERMRITSAGNVGIGTSSPSVRLSVPVPTQNVGTSNVFRIFDDGAASSSTNNNSYGMGMDTDTGRFAFTAGNGGAFAFFTQNTERARIDASGRLLVGTTAPQTETAAFIVRGAAGIRASSLFEVQNTTGDFAQCQFVNPNGVVGSIRTNGTTTSYSTSSDYRLKANVVPLTDAAARVQALKPCRFNFIADPDRTVDGFIAHEAAEVIPEAVHGEKDAVNEDGSIKPQGIDQSKLVPLLTAALQEALTEIAALKARVAVLEAR